MRIKAKRTRLANVSNKRAGVPRSSNVTLVHPPYDWEREEREDLERWLSAQEARDDLWDAIQEEREATWPW